MGIQARGAGMPRARAHGECYTARVAQWRKPRLPTIRRWKRPRDKFLQVLSNRGAGANGPAGYRESSVCRAVAADWPLEFKQRSASRRRPSQPLQPLVSECKSTLCVCVCVCVSVSLSFSARVVSQLFSSSSPWDAAANGRTRSAGISRAGIIIICRG